MVFVLTLTSQDKNLGAIMTHYKGFLHAKKYQNNLIFTFVVGLQNKIQEILILGKDAQNMVKYGKVKLKRFFFAELANCGCKKSALFRALNQQQQNSMSTKPWMKYSTQTI
jgi:hypothetical protein